MFSDPDTSDDGVLARLTALRQYRRGGHRAPHKPLLVLLALGRLARTGSSALPWMDVRDRLAGLIAGVRGSGAGEPFGPAAAGAAA